MRKINPKIYAVFVLLLIALFAALSLFGCKPIKRNCSDEIFGSSYWITPPLKYKFDLQSDTVFVEFISGGGTLGLYNFSDDCNILTLSDLAGINSSTYSVEKISDTLIKWIDENNSTTFLNRE